MTNILRITGSFASILTLALALSCSNDDGNQISPTLIGFTETQLNFSESDQGYTVAISFSEEMTSDGQIAVSLSGTATYGEDYSLSPELLEELYYVDFEEGDMSTSFALNLIDDEIIEDDETIVLTLIQESEELSVGLNETLTINLTSEEEDEVRAEFSQQALTVSETEETAILTIDFNKPLPFDAIFLVSYRADSSLYGDDFTLEPLPNEGFLELNALKGDETISFNLNLVQNPFRELIEYVVFRLSSDTEGVRIGQDRLEVQIQD